MSIMEIDDEDVVAHGTDFQKYLDSVGYTEFEVSKQKMDENLCLSKRCPKQTKYYKTNKIQTNCLKNFGLYITLIKIIMESQLIFKEDTLFIKEFIPSDHIGCSLFFSKQKSLIFFLSFIICGFMNVFFSKYCNTWTAVCLLIFWFGYAIMDILYNFYQKRTIKNKTLNTIKTMRHLSLLIQKTTHFLQECNNLHSIYNSCNDTRTNSNSVFMYLLMPEFKILFLTIIQDLTNNLVYSISQVLTFFQLKNSVSKTIYLYLTDCKVDVQNTSLENINKAKYTYLLLQSEFLKLSTLCMCPVLWIHNNSSKINCLIETFYEIKKLYSNSYNILSEEYNTYSLFKNKNIDCNKSQKKDYSINQDLKLKVYNVRQFLQNMMVHVRFMEDSIENSKFCIDDINSTINMLVKEINVFNELILSLQMYMLKTNNEDKKNKTALINNSFEINNHIETDINESTKLVNEDELFFGISEEVVEEADNKCCDEDIFDKSNNQNLLLELKIALKNKQEEWKQREDILLEKHSLLKVLSEEEECNETPNQNINKIRKVASDLPPNENIPMQLPNKSFANEIAMVACKWNTVIESFGDDPDSDTSLNSADS